MLTDQALKSDIVKAKAEKRPVFLRDSGKSKGLEFRASYGGSGSFAFLYKKDGAKVPKRYYLGQYGPIFGLANARREVEVLRGKLRAGIDPAVERDAIAAEQAKADAERKAAENALKSRVKFSDMAKGYLKAGSHRRIYWNMYEAEPCRDTGHHGGRRHHAVRHPARHRGIARKQSGGST